ncbi:MAG: (2E,6E)-farnesyl diphosphate synthase [Gammaproteobacteria bacterium]
MSSGGAAAVAGGDEAHARAQTRLRMFQERVHEALDRRLPAAEVSPQRLHGAMRYAVLNGGKRVRAVLVYATGEALRADLEALDAPAAAVEMIHAYSLVHDDLPCMDDDDLRRGQPTCHRAYDEATAMLAGDALQALAFETIALNDCLGASARVEMMSALANASGSLGMAGGQGIDLDSVGQDLTLDQLERMHRKKTGALIRASVRLGALASPKLDFEKLRQLDSYAACVGLAFQIQDDILDVEGDTEVIGKTSGADAALNKPTYTSLLGLELARQRARALVAEAIDNIAWLEERGALLDWLAGYIVERRS